MDRAERIYQDFLKAEDRHYDARFRSLKRRGSKATEEELDQAKLDFGEIYDDVDSVLTEVSDIGFAKAAIKAGMDIVSKIRSGIKYVDGYEGDEDGPKKGGGIKHWKLMKQDTRS